MDVLSGHQDASIGLEEVTNALLIEAGEAHGRTFHLDLRDLFVGDPSVLGSVAREAEPNLTFGEGTVEVPRPNGLVFMSSLTTGMPMCRSVSATSSYLMVSV